MTKKGPEVRWRHAIRPAHRRATPRQHGTRTWHALLMMLSDGQIAMSTLPAASLDAGVLA